MTDMSNIDIVERDVSSVGFAANDSRKKEDRKCKLTEHSYINVSKKANGQKYTVQQTSNSGANEKEVSSTNFEPQQTNSSEVELVQLAELYIDKNSTTPEMQYIKSKALRMAGSMIVSMTDKYDEIVHIEKEDKIDLEEIDFDSIKKAVTDNLANAELNVDSDVNSFDSDLSYKEANEDSYDEEPVWENDQESVVDDSDNYNLYEENNVVQEDISPIIPSISEYQNYGVEQNIQDGVGIINESVFTNNISGIEEGNNMEYQSSDRVMSSSSSTEDLESLQEQLRTITTKRDRMIKLTEETLMKEANEARELAEAHAQTREAYEMVNNLIEGISQEIDREQEKVSQSQRKIEQYTAEKQREAEKQRVLNEMVGAYSTNAQNVSGIGANFIKVGRTR